MKGLHLIADLYDCSCVDELLIDKKTLEEICISDCKTTGLTPIGSYFYQFYMDNGDKAGVTGSVVLAESHLAIHTWPENAGVTLDVYVCNYSRDNSDRARELFNSIIKKLNPEKIQKTELVRGDQNGHKTISS